MYNIYKRFFKIKWALLLVLLVPVIGFAVRKTNVPAPNTGNVAVVPEPLQAQPITNLASEQGTKPKTGNLAAARDKERVLQELQKAVNFRKIGKVALIKEIARQEERDGLSEQPLQAVIEAPASQSNRFTQTEAHLFLPRIRELITTTYKVEPYLNLISKVIFNEAKYRDTHYAFYNTTSNMWRLAQDLDTRLFARFNPTIESDKFKFLRFNNEFINSTAQGFLVNELKEKGLVNDNTDIKSIMLSVNLSLFGNVGFSGECSWDYFVDPKSHAAPWRETYEKMMIKYGLTDKYIDELMTLVDIYNTKEDTILQILIPKNKVDEIGYLAWVRGIPAHGETVKFILNTASTKNYTFGTKPVFDKLTEEFAQQKETNPLYKSMIEDVEKGAFSLDSFLKVYCNKPWDLKEINDVTARLLFTPSVLGDPESGVIIQRLSTVPQIKLKEYNDRLNAIIEKMVAEKEAAEDAELSAVSR